MRIVMIGAPGSGKGTQSKMLSEKYGVPQISTGDILRAAVAAGSALGLQAKSAMDAGQLVSDDVVLGLIKERLASNDAERGFILDGIPRNVEQARYVQEMLADSGQPIELVIHLDVDFDTVLQRLGGRRVCESCGATYNVYFSPPKFEDRCDECGGELKHRSDDKDETIANRMRVYDQLTDPVIGFYRERGLLSSVDGSEDPQTIFDEIDRVIVDNCEIPPAMESVTDIEAALIESLSEELEDSSGKVKQTSKKSNKNLKNVAKGDEKGVGTKSKKKKSTKKKKTGTKKSASGRKTKAKKKKAAVKKRTTAKKAVRKSKSKKAKAKEKVMRKKKSAAKKKTAAKKKKTTAKKKRGGAKKKAGGAKKKKRVAKKKTAKKKTAKKKAGKKKAAKKKGRKKKK